MGSEARRGAAPTLCVIVPFFNEETLLPELKRRLSAVMDSMGSPYEVIAVDDGSQDGTAGILRRIHAEDRRWKVLELSRNFGHGSACTAGLDHTRADVVAFLDADLQDPPELIPIFLAKWREGYDVVYGSRTKRGESAVRRGLVRGFYRILNALSDTALPEDAGIFSLLDRQAVDALRQLPERHRYLTGLRSWVGFRQTGVPYEREVRRGAPPSQTWAKLFGLAADAIFSFSSIPLRLATLMGLALALGSFLLAAEIVYLKLFTQRPILGWSSTMLAIVLIGGMILATLGIIGEYVGRIYNEIKQRPLYIIKDKMGFDGGTGPAV
jgi:polyisoprenyl-phosphate glycosyltransferase